MTGAVRVGSSVPRLRRAYAACSRPSATGNGAPAPCCTDKALDEAMEVFWRHGYDGASLAMPTRAMGIEAPSLYAAFGSKEGLLKGPSTGMRSAGPSTCASPPRGRA